ncbi:hypothetical protein AMTR_s00104p00114810 [Amborella trichopoda]|uniref:Uncharacterized protein n=1 Tax=Amborella trichopoda TaxID=13333 RepID=W1P097_AMBTC|nr:hypothetical protein AMTR_s00104p00114810 [Amborella trichopoda]
MQKVAKGAQIRHGCACHGYSRSVMALNSSAKPLAMEKGAQSCQSSVRAVAPVTDIARLVTTLTYGKPGASNFKPMVGHIPAKKLLL